MVEMIKGMPFMGAFPLISLIGNSKVVKVASVLMLFLFLSPIVDFYDPGYNRCSSDYSSDCLVGEIGSSGCSRLVVSLSFPNLDIDKPINILIF